MTYLSLNDVPDYLFPIHVSKAYNRQCGWWITTDDSGLAGRRGYPVRYCSLPPGHDDSHVWRTPPIDFGHATKETA